MSCVGQWSREKRRRRRWERWKELGLVWFVFFFHHSSLITLNTTPIWHHYSIFFTLFVGPILVTRCIFFFPVPKLIEPSEKKKKKTPEQIEPVKERRRRKKKKKNRTANQEKKGKKKSKVVKSYGWVLFVGPLCLFNYNIAIELWAMKTENSQNVFFVSITHNSKIKKLSDGNRVMTSQITFLLWVLLFLSYEL